MNDDVSALHMAARRYCADRAAHWSAVYAQMRAARGPEPGPYSYRDEDYRVFPRYNVLDAIRSAIERWLPDEVATVDLARARLIEAARTARSPFTEQPQNAIEAATLAEERDAFERFARESTPARWAEADPLPFRRVLAAAEADAAYDEVRSRWGTWSNGYGDRDDVPAHVTLHTEVWAGLPLLAVVRAALAGRGVTRLLEIASIGDSYERAVDDVDFRRGDDTHWIVRGGDWMIYGSFESSITFGGDGLVTELRRALPALDDFVYRGWDDPPSRRR